MRSALGEFLEKKDAPTAADLARRLGVSESAVSRWARALRRPDSWTAQDIERETGIPASYWKTLEIDRPKRSRGRAGKRRPSPRRQRLHKRAQPRRLPRRRS